MRLSPLDIKKQEFARGFRGYEIEEVQAFLQMVSRQWEDTLEQQRHLEDRVRQYEAKLEHYEKVEMALEEALRTARENAKKTQEHAEKQAQLILREAEVKAERIVQEADQRQRNLRQDLSSLTARRSEIATRLKAFLTSELEVLAQFESSPATTDTPGDPQPPEKLEPVPAAAPQDESARIRRILEDLE